MVSIVIESLTKRFGDSPVLNDINLHIQHGELFFLLGPSGCGKTTLLRHIAGFYRPDRGSIHFDREDVTHLPAYQRGIGMMFQSYALWPHLTVAENVAFGLEERKRPKKEIKERVDETLTLVQLSELGQRKIQQLSGGQQQRVALARALVVRPKCLLLDEPLSNLDAKLRLEMRTEIRRLCKQFGLTGIYVTHDQEEALSMADRMAIMEGGKLAQIGTPLEVYRNPATRMAAEFIGESNFIEGQVRGPGTDFGSYEVETPVGRLIARSHSDHWRPVASARVFLSVRPEALSFGDRGDSPNRFEGHIVESLYLGATAQYHLQLAAGAVIKITTTNPVQLFETSQQPVIATAQVDDVVLLPA